MVHAQKLSFMLLLVVGRIIGTTGLHPSVNLISLELPESADALGGHVLFFNPSVDSVIAHAEVGAYIPYRQPTIFHLSHLSISSKGVLIKESLACFHKK